MFKPRLQRVLLGVMLAAACAVSYAAEHISPTTLTTGPAQCIHEITNGVTVCIESVSATLAIVPAVPDSMYSGLGARANTAPDWDFVTAVTKISTCGTVGGAVPLATG